MDPMIEGLIEVATPPNGAGKRGRTPSYNWDAIVEALTTRPWRQFVLFGVPSNLMPRLQERYPEIEFLGHNHRMRVPPVAPSTTGQQVCDLYMRWTGGHG